MSTINLTGTVEFCAEDRERLQQLVAAFEQRSDEHKQLLAALKQMNDEQLRIITELFQSAESKLHAPPVAPVVTVPEAETPVHTPETPAPEPKVAPERVVTREQLRGKVIDLTRAGARDETRAIVMSYADHLDRIPEDKLVEVWDKLTELGGKA